MYILYLIILGKYYMDIKNNGKNKVNICKQIQLRKNYLKCVYNYKNKEDNKYYLNIKIKKIKQKQHMLNK